MEDDYSSTIKASDLKAGQAISSRNGHGVCSTTVTGTWRDSDKMIVSTRLGHLAYWLDESVTISRY